MGWYRLLSIRRNDACFPYLTESVLIRIGSITMHSFYINPTLAQLQQNNSRKMVDILATFIMQHILYTKSHIHYYATVIITELLYKKICLQSQSSHGCPATPKAPLVPCCIPPLIGLDRHMFTVIQH